MASVRSGGRRDELEVEVSRKESAEGFVDDFDDRSFGCDGDGCRLDWVRRIC